MADFLLSFMWVWSGVVVGMLVFKTMGLGHGHLSAEILKAALSITNMFFFAFLAEVTRGGAYNPLTVLSSAFSGDFRNFLYCVGARIPAQVRNFCPVKLTLVVLQIVLSHVLNLVSEIFCAIELT